MNDSADQVRDHYDEGDDLVARVTRALEGMAEPVSSAQLAGFDQFHVRGLAATADLGALLSLGRNSVVLDAGSGLGGPSRYMAEAFGCSVMGIDLTPSYVAVSKLLAERTGLAGRVDYATGDLLALKLSDALFDAAYTQHVVMNIRDRAGAYREIRRVLKPGGRFGFYDVLAADGGAPPLYPVPWAETSDTSVLLTEAETRDVMVREGLTPETWTDVTAPALTWFAQLPPPSTQAPNLGLVMGPRFAAMTANFMRNLSEGRLRLMMGTCIAVG
jgi:sarcosine/dimethylglycine N-methyltransferase